MPSESSDRQLMPAMRIDRDEVVRLFKQTEEIESNWCSLGEAVDNLLDEYKLVKSEDAAKLTKVRVQLIRCLGERNEVRKDRILTDLIWNHYRAIAASKEVAELLNLPKERLHQLVFPSITGVPGFRRSTSNNAKLTDTIENLEKQSHGTLFVPDCPEMLAEFSESTFGARYTARECGATADETARMYSDRRDEIFEQFQRAERHFETRMGRGKYCNRDSYVENRKITQGPLGRIWLQWECGKHRPLDPQNGFLYEELAMIRERVMRYGIPENTLQCAEYFNAALRNYLAISEQGDTLTDGDIIVQATELLKVYSSDDFRECEGIRAHSSGLYFVTARIEGFVINERDLFRSLGTLWQSRSLLNMISNEWRYIETNFCYEAILEAINSDYSPSVIIRAIVTKGGMIPPMQKSRDSSKWFAMGARYLASGEVPYLVFADSTLCTETEILRYTLKKYTQSVRDEMNVNFVSRGMATRTNMLVEKSTRVFDSRVVPGKLVPRSIIEYMTEYDSRYPFASQKERISAMHDFRRHALYRRHGVEDIELDEIRVTAINAFIV